jgi:ACS family D-galactonate transporter-like MFS transporter
VVGLLSLGFTLAYVDRTILSIALASADFKGQFALSDNARGLLNSAFFWSYALLQVPCGYLTDRYGVRRPYAIAIFGWSIISGLTCLASSLWQLFTIRLLLGAGEAIVTPASIRWIATNIPERHRGLAVGILFAGAKFGPAIGAQLAVMLIEALGWRWMFLILGGGSAVFVIPWLMLVRDGPAAGVRSGASGAASLGGIWRSPVIYGILLGTVAYNYFNYFNLTWLPAYFVEQWDLPLSSMGAYTAFSFLGMAATAIGSGALADLLIRRGAPAVAVRKLFTVGGLAIASLEIVGATTSSRELAVAAAMVAMAGLGLTTANYWALTQTLMQGAAIGRIAGLQNFASNLAGIAAPALTGWLIHSTGNYRAPLWAILAVLLMGVIAYVFLVREKYARPAKDYWR